MRRALENLPSPWGEGVGEADGRGEPALHPVILRSKATKDLILEW